MQYDISAQQLQDFKFDESMWVVHDYKNSYNRLPQGELLMTNNNSDVKDRVGENLFALIGKIITKYGGFTEYLKKQSRARCWYIPAVHKTGKTF